MAEIKQIRFVPTEEDVPIMVALEARLGLKPPAIFRYCMREVAVELGVWKPPEAPKGEAATGTNG